MKHLKPFLPGLIIVFIGILLFWASTRKTLSPAARTFLEGQATICMPAGLAALGIGAWNRKGENGKEENGKEPKESRDPEAPKGKEE